jgi:hypothetical protein
VANGIALLIEAKTEFDRVRPLIEAHPGVCVYCGWISDDLDHIAARALSGEHRFVVPACRRCNCVLQVHPTVSIRGRSLWLAERERAKGRKLLRMPGWSDAEIARFGRAIQDDLLRRMAAKGLLVDRLRNLDCGGIGQEGWVPL